MEQKVKEEKENTEEGVVADFDARAWTVWVYESEEDLQLSPLQHDFLQEEVVEDSQG